MRVVVVLGFADIVAAGEAYGRSDTGAGRTINLEFVSANPTGPMHIGHTRWAALGDAIAQFEQAGHLALERGRAPRAQQRGDELRDEVVSGERLPGRPRDGLPGGQQRQIGGAGMAPVT